MAWRIWWSQIKKLGSVVHSADEIHAPTASDVGCLFVDGTATALGAAGHTVGNVAPTTALGKLQWRQKIQLPHCCGMQLPHCCKGPWEPTWALPGVGLDVETPQPYNQAVAVAATNDVGCRTHQWIHRKSQKLRHQYIHQHHCDFASAAFIWAEFLPG